MSLTLLRLIPVDPHLVPEPTRRQAGRDLLAGLVGDPSSVCDLIQEQVSLVDCGGNLERISCPRCGAPLTEEWWGEAMDAAHRTGFRELVVALPCCRGSCSLNDLHYDWPMGFARYVLEARDPGVNHLASDQLQRLEDALGCKLRIIWARY